MAVAVAEVVEVAAEAGGGGVVAAEVVAAEVVAAEVVAAEVVAAARR